MKEDEDPIEEIGGGSAGGRTLGGTTVAFSMSTEGSKGGEPSSNEKNKENEESD
jgi:hypothetical protein